MSAYLPIVDTANRPWPTSVAPRRVSSGRVARGPVAPRKMACRPLAGKASIRGSRPSTRDALVGLQLNEHLEHEDGAVVFRHACKMGLEGIVSKRLGSPYISGRTRHWLKFKNPAAPAVKREAEEDWGR